MKCQLFKAVLLLVVIYREVECQCEAAGPEDWDFADALAKDSPRFPCPPINYYECMKWGSYVASNGCKTCCCPRIAADCLKYGNYFDQNQCRHCCHPHSLSLCLKYGFWKNILGCKVCCPAYVKSQCELYGWYLDGHGCVVCCNSSKAAGTCQKGALVNPSGGNP